MPPDTPRNYEGLGHVALGRWGTWVSEFTFIFGGFGTLVAYFIFFTELIREVIGVSKSYKWIITIVCVGSVVMPLSCLRNISALRHTPLVAVFTVVYVCSVVLAATVSSGH